jgi:hypothetical protein
MPAKRRVSKQRFTIQPVTEAFIRGEPWPEGTSGMARYWHRYSLWAGHVNCAWGYSVEDACRALGVDIEEVRRRYDVQPRYRGDGHGGAA